MTLLFSLLHTAGETSPLAVQKESMYLTATILFAVAVAHTFVASKILHLSHRFAEGSIRGSLLHLLGEVETVFGVWAMVFVAFWAFHFGSESAISFLESVNFAEPIFVFAIMCVSATRPVLKLAEFLIDRFSSLFPVPKPRALFLSALILGPLLGSFITEPAAMTVVALVFREKFFQWDISPKLRYGALAVLFVNISIGGTLTHFAAPPVLMVAGPWSWDTLHMLMNFGWKATIAVVINTVLAAWYFRDELDSLGDKEVFREDYSMDSAYWWMAMSHIIFILPLVLFSTSIVLIVPVFIFFLGWHAASQKFQDDLRLRESLLVAFFLGGLVTLGKLQGWWIQPIISSLDATPLFWGATGLTAITDNAALTYLATLVPTISEGAKYAVVAGAVTGGGLTLIANAPNLAGYSILGDTFKGGFNPLWLFIAAIPFTLVAALAFTLL